VVGRRALVTGGSKGVGAAIVARLSESGATVIDRVGERFGALDILVNTLGGSRASSGGFAALSDEQWHDEQWHDEQWHDELNVNLLAAVRLDRGLLPAMIKAGSGVVVHVSSIQSRMPL
jgi:NAD(P)-dependent dehydrogenase (short-subunit alcohol dehydrogenase family)